MRCLFFKGFFFLFLFCVCEQFNYRSFWEWMLSVFFFLRVRVGWGLFFGVDCWEFSFSKVLFIVFELLGSLYVQQGVKLKFFLSQGFCDFIVGGRVLSRQGQYSGFCDLKWRGLRVGVFYLGGYGDFVFGLFYIVYYMDLV